MFNKIFIFFSLLFLFIFFWVTEWRWEAMLFGFPDIKPHITTALFAVVVVLLGVFGANGKSIPYWMICLLMCYFIAVSALNAKELNGTLKYELTKEFGVLCIYFALFVAAANPNMWKLIYARPKVILYLYVVSIVPLFFILFYSGSAHPSHFNLRGAIELSGLIDNSDYGISYQSIGDKIAIMSFFVLSFNIRQKLKAIILIYTFAALYIIGGKASMIGFVFAIVAYYIILLFSKKQYVKCIAILFASLCMCLGMLFCVVGQNSFERSGNWIVRTIAHGRNDNSISSRHKIEENNQRTRVSRILLGDYKFDFKLGRPGSNTHSVIGIIDYYGVPIFIITVGLWLYFIFTLLFAMKRNTPIISATTLAMLFYTLLFITARCPTETYLFYFVLGTATAAIQQHTIDLHHKLTLESVDNRYLL